LITAYVGRRKQQKLDYHNYLHV